MCCVGPGGSPSIWYPERAFSSDAPSLPLFFVSPQPIVLLSLLSPPFRLVLIVCGTRAATGHSSSRHEGAAQRTGSWKEVRLLRRRQKNRQKSKLSCINAVTMAPSFTSRPRSGVGGESRPVSRDSDNLVIPNRTSSLHSRIVQPMPNTMAQQKPAQRAPKTLTHAYMVCGVGREPSQWVKAPQPAQGKIGHMKGAVGQFWLPEILGSSPRLEQDNEIARSLHSAMRVSAICTKHAAGPRI